MTIEVFLVMFVYGLGGYMTIEPYSSIDSCLAEAQRIKDLPLVQVECNALFSEEDSMINAVSIAFDDDD